MWATLTRLHLIISKVFRLSMTISIPAKVPLAALPTPLVPLDRLSASLGGPRIWLKRDDLTHTSMSGNKLRKLEFIVAEALSQSCTVLITCGGVQSNHCRATALACAQQGLGCHLILRGEKPKELDGNVLLAKLAGAIITFVPADQYTSQLSTILSQTQDDYQVKGQNAFVIPTGASDELGLWGYYSAVPELIEDFQRLDLNVDMVCCATGSGGTHAGLALGFHHSGHTDMIVRGYAVCDNRHYFEKKAAEDIQRWYQRYLPGQPMSMPTLDVNDQYIGGGYGVAGPEVFAVISLLAAKEGVILDPVYTAKAFLGLVSQIRNGELAQVKNVVFVHTGGVFGLFPFRRSFSEAF